MIFSKTKKVRLRQTVNWLVPGYATAWKNPDSHPGIGILNTLSFLKDDLIKHNIVIVCNINPSCKAKDKKTLSAQREQDYNWVWRPWPSKMIANKDKNFKPVNRSNLVA